MATFSGSNLFAISACTHLISVPYSFRINNALQLRLTEVTIMLRVFQVTVNGRVFNKMEQFVNEFYVEPDRISVGLSQKNNSNSEELKRHNMT